MKLSKLIAGVLALGLCGAASHAATVAVTFSGVLANQEFYGSNTSSSWNIGDSVAATFIYNDAQQPSFDALGVATYAVTSGSFKHLESGYEVKTDPDFAVLQLFHLRPNGFPSSQYRLSGLASGDIGDFGASGIDDTATAFNSTDLSEFHAGNLAPSAGKFPSQFLDITFYSNGAVCQDCTQSAVVTSVTFEEVAPVPVPAALPLMVLGLAGLGFAGRRRGRID